MKKMKIRRITRIRDRAKRVYVRRLQQAGKIRVYELDGYLAYDSDELKLWHKTAKVGRPIKKQTIKVEKGD